MVSKEPETLGAQLLQLALIKNRCGLLVTQLERNRLAAWWNYTDIAKLIYYWGWADTLIRRYELGISQEELDTLQAMVDDYENWVGAEPAARLSHRAVNLYEC